jgi:hypothetical protein
MSYASLHDRFSGGAIVPNRHSSFTISDSTLLPDNTVEITLNITASGNVSYEMLDGTVVAMPYPAAGLYKEVGQYKRVKSTGTTVTLSPATTVFVKYIV